MSQPMLSILPILLMSVAVQDSGEAPAPPTIEVAPLALSAEQQATVRCAITFANVAARQAQADPAVAGYPDLTERGREFFVRSMAQLMDDLQIKRPQLRLHLTKAAEEITQPGKVEELMPACLLMLDAAGL